MAYRLHTQSIFRSRTSSKLGETMNNHHFLAVKNTLTDQTAQHREATLNPFHSRAWILSALIFSASSAAFAYDVPPGGYPGPMVDLSCKQELEHAIKADADGCVNVQIDERPKLYLDSKAVLEKGVAPGSVHTRKCMKNHTIRQINNVLNEDRASVGQLDWKWAAQKLDYSSPCHISRGISSDVHTQTEDLFLKTFSYERQIIKSSQQLSPNVFFPQNPPDYTNTIHKKSYKAKPMGSTMVLEYSFSDIVTASRANDVNSNLIINAKWWAEADQTKAPLLRNFSVNATTMQNGEIKKGKIEIRPEGDEGSYRLELEVVVNGWTHGLVFDGEMCLASSENNSRKEHIELACKDVYDSWMQIFRSLAKESGVAMGLYEPNVLGNIAPATTLFDHPEVFFLREINYSREVSIPFNQLRGQILQSKTFN